MSLIVKNQILGIITKNPQAQGVYQFEVINALVTSSNGFMDKEPIITRMMKKCTLSASTLRSHCVWRVLANKGVIKIIDKSTVELLGFDDLEPSEKNEIRNEANKARRAWEAKQ